MQIICKWVIITLRPCLFRGGYVENQNMLKPSKCAANCVNRSSFLSPFRGYQGPSAMLKGYPFV